MNIENTKAQMRKGVLEMCVLAIISEESIYPSDIIKKLKAAKLIVKEGTLYPLLTRLKNASLLTYEWQESTQGGPPRKYYEITDSGHSFLMELQENWNQLLNAVHLTTKNIHQQ